MTVETFITEIKNRFSGAYAENIWLDECDKDQIVLSEDNTDHIDIDDPGRNRTVNASIYININNNWEFCIDAIYEDNDNKIFSRTGNDVKVFYNELSKPFPVGEKWKIQEDLLIILKKYIQDIPE